MDNLEVEEWIKWHKDVDTVLSCCYNLTELSLGGGRAHSITSGHNYNCITNSDLFFNVTFPKLLKFSIKWNKYLSNVHLMEFLQSNTRLRSARIVTRVPLDISGILDLPFEELVICNNGDQP